MDKLEAAIEQTVTEQLYRLIVSKPFTKSELTKVVVRPVLVKGQLLFQETRYVGTKVLHHNYQAEEIRKRLEAYLRESFGRLEGECADCTVAILTNKKGTVTVKKRKRAAGMTDSSKENYLAHNRTKKYILEDGEPVDFLIALGVQTPEGRVVKAKYHKFKQINRYLELVEDILPKIQKEDSIRIIDFGCGKSYLTFALYYYLKIKHNKDVEIIGLDLKKDVIADCNRLKEKLGYHGLTFLQGDIKDYENKDRIDMVVSLHACDTSTDYAIAKALSWKASVIMAVPCCQHEVNRQIRCEQLNEVLKYGIIKERISALITDAYRADCLENNGYETQILEFIDLEHTPKNLLIRAVKKDDIEKGDQAVRMQSVYRKAPGDDASLKALEEYLHIRPLLGKLLAEEKVWK